MKIKRVFILIPLLVLVVSCVRENTVNHDCRYNVKIRYERNNDSILNSSAQYRLANDSLYLLFEYQFKNDRVTLYKNKKVVFDDTIKTSDVTGLAKYIKLGKLNEINNIGIRVNNGNIAFAELCPKHHEHIVKINFINKELIITFTNKEPRYY